MTAALPGRLRFAIVLIVLLLLAVYCALSPYIVTWQTIKAMDDGNANLLNDVVDFPALRSSLRADFDARMRKELRNNPYAGLGTTLEESLVNSLASADGLIAIAHGGPFGSYSRSVEAPGFSDVFRAYRGRYLDFNKFLIYTDTGAGKDTNGETGLLLCRHVFTWKICGLKVPMQTSGAQ